MTIREYKKSDLKVLEQFMNKLQDYTVYIDQMKRNARADNYGEHFAKETIKEVEEDNGAMFIVEDNGKPVGFIAGIIKVQSEADKLSGVDLRAEGRIIELFVEESYRGKGVGKMLMEKIEKYFKEKGCGVVRVEVFEPNKSAHNFYEKMGYGDRTIDMLKIL